MTEGEPGSREGGLHPAGKPPVKPETTLPTSEQPKVGPKEVQPPPSQEPVLQPTPVQPKEKVTLNSINIKRRLPVNWDALKDLAREINRLKDTPIEKEEILALKPTEYINPAIPKVASVIANKRNPEISVSLPTAEEVKAMKPWLRDAARLIGLFSKNWAERFDKYIERRGGSVVTDVGLKICEFTDSFATIENPREEFLIEIRRLYDQLTAEESTAIDRDILHLLDDMEHISYGGELDQVDFLDAEDFPLLVRLLPIVKFPPAGFDKGGASIAAAEFMQGVESFLRQEGIEDIKPAPGPPGFNLLDLLFFGPSVQRLLAEWFAAEKLERVKNSVPSLLHHAQQTLPENGPQFAQAIYGTAEKVVALKKQGKSDKEIADSLFSA